MLADAISSFAETGSSFNGQTVALADRFISIICLKSLWTARVCLSTAGGPTARMRVRFTPKQGTASEPREGMVEGGRALAVAIAGRRLLCERFPQRNNVSVKSAATVTPREPKSRLYIVLKSIRKSGAASSFMRFPPYFYFLFSRKR